MNVNQKNLFRYNDWANKRVLESLYTTTSLNEKAQLLFSHICISQTIWLERILSKQTTFKSTMILLSLDRCKNLGEQSTKEWINFIEKTPEENFNSIIKYSNTRGVKIQNKLADIVTHVINHSTYHRGQIALLVRNAGGVPADTDYITYYRI